ncbi:MAG: hypothetical protein EAZ53_10460 [Bacteroidetes bacterium]|nr:MAG: hypothetical protein EAZ53_10460 [Bacteroidota bacterium]
MLHWIYNPTRKVKRAFDELDREKKIHDQEDHNIIQDILQMAKENGLRPSDIKSLEHEIDAEFLVTPTNNLERLNQLIYMEKIMMADLNMDTAELDFLIEFARFIHLPSDIAPLIVRDIYFDMRAEKTDLEIVEDIITGFNLL